MNTKQLLLNELIESFKRELNEELPDRTDDFYEKEAFRQIRDQLSVVKSIRLKAKKEKMKSLAPLVRAMFK